MGFAHSFPNIVPPARYGDALPWSHVTVEQASTAGGPWAELTVQSIADELVTEMPAPVNISVVSDLAAGWFRFRFSDAADVVSDYSDAFESPSDVVIPDQYRPSVAQLAAIMRARTKNVNGDEEGTFTDETRPTALDAAEIISQAMTLVAGRLGPVPSRLGSLATSLVALRAAMTIEVSFFPEETNNDQSAYERYREQYTDAIGMYNTALEGGAVVGEPNTGFYSLPITTDLNPLGVYGCCPDELCG